jgi:ABC-type sugar transport system ATPase subunit
VPKVALHNLSKTFAGPDRSEIRALRSLTLEVKARELLVLAGPSGSGKTTLLRLIAGLDKPTTGTIHIDDEPVHNLPPAQRKLAMVFQESTLYPHLTAHQNLALALHASRLPAKEVQARIENIADQLGLRPLLNRRPAQLSGGEQQRVALGRALIRRPAVLLLDEPLSSLDAPLRLQLRLELARWQAELGLTMIYVTHDQSEAMALGHRIALLREGSLEQLGPPAELYRHPRHKFVAGFLGAPPMNFFKGTISASEKALLFRERETPAASALGQLSLRLPDALRSRLEPYASRNVELGLRPEHMRCEGCVAGSTDAATWTATLQRMQNTGSDCHLFCATQTHAFIVRAEREEAPSQLLTIVPDLAQAHFFDSSTGLALT